MTRREWLRQNKAPAASGEIADREAELRETGNVNGAAMIHLQVGAAAQCPQHAGELLWKHRNRIEDLFVCQRGPHYLLWTWKSPGGGGGQLVPVASLADVPPLDEQMR